LSGDAEGGVGRAVPGVAFSPLHDLEEKAVAIDPAIKLEVLPVIVPVVEDIQRCSRSRTTGSRPKRASRSS
jgi:hypothetical protein